MRWSIRPYQEADLDNVARLWLESWTSTGLSIAGSTTVGELRERIERELRSKWSMFVTFSSDLVGFLALKEDDRCLDQPFVAPAHQGRGIGQSLLAFAKGRMPTGIWL